MPSIDDQIEAWEIYASAKSRADNSLRFEDGLLAVKAWKQFANLYLQDDREMPLEDRGNIIRFPPHRVSGDAP